MKRPRPDPATVDAVFELLYRQVERAALGACEAQIDATLRAVARALEQPAAAAPPATGSPPK